MHFHIPSPLVSLSRPVFLVGNPSSPYPYLEFYIRMSCRMCLPVEVFQDCSSARSALKTQERRSRRRGSIDQGRHPEDMGQKQAGRLTSTCLTPLLLRRNSSNVCIVRSTSASPAAFASKHGDYEPLILSHARVGGVSLMKASR